MPSTMFNTIINTIKIIGGTNSWITSCRYKMVNRLNEPIFLCVSFDRFAKLLTEFIRKDGFIVQFFAFVEDDSNRLLAVVRNSQLYVLEH